jgi:protein phosphatase 1 regulatory subunit 11
MALATQIGPSGAMSREGSRTALVVQNPAEQQRDASAALLPELTPPAGTLRLRGGPRNGPRVAWDEAVVDNEGLGRKKSKSTLFFVLQLDAREYAF